MSMVFCCSVYLWNCLEFDVTFSGHDCSVCLAVSCNLFAMVIW